MDDNQLFLVINTIVLLFLNILYLWLAFWIFLADKKNKLNRLFFWMSIFVILWTTFAYIGNFLSQGEAIKVWAKLGYGMAAIFAIPFYFFSNLFPRLEKKFPVIDKMVVILSLSLFYIAVFTNLLVVGVVQNPLGSFPVLGPYRIVYFGPLLLMVLLIVFRMFRKYFNLSLKEKLKAQYFLIGLFLFIGLNAIFNVILPYWQENPQYYQFGNYSTVFLVVFTAIAIIKRQLFGIRVVLTQFLVGLIAVLLLVNVFVSETTFEYCWKGGLFLAFLVFGWLLVKSVLREIKYREQLQKVYREVKKAKATLEKKVKERTKELAKEKKLADTHREIAEERARRLERWYGSIVGRELKMVELKEKINELEEKLKKTEKG